MRDSNYVILNSGSNTDSWFRELSQFRDVIVFHVDLVARDGCVSGALQWLDRNEHSRLRRYHFDRSRIEFGLCRSALRQIVCNFMGCDNEQLSFVTNEHGKPIPLIDGLTASISVNVSHSGKHGIVGIAPHGKLGIDIEIPVQRKDLEGISKMVFTPKEQSELEKVSGIEKIDLFYKLWTLKEALIKAVGTGFSLNPSRFEIPSDLRKGAMKGAFKFPHLPHINWTLDCLEGKDFIASIAYARVIS